MLCINKSYGGTQYFQDSIGGYQQAEQLVQKAASHLNVLKSYKVTPISQTNTWKPSPFKTDVMNVTHRYHSTLKKDRNLIDYLRNGACIGGFAGFDMFRFQAKKEMKYLSAGGEVRVGTANVSGDAKALLFQNGKFNPALQLEAEANATLAQAGMYMNIGNDYVNAKGEANVKVGTVSAEAKAVFKKEEITLKAKVGAAAVKGEVKGSISLFGLTISATATGEICSVGAGLEFSSKSGEFEFGGKASLFAGAGFKIRVNY